MDGPTWTRNFEGLTLIAVPDAGGFSIGRGHHGPDVFPGLVWTVAQADAMFEDEDYPRAIRGALIDYGEPLDPLGEPRKAALVDLAYEDGGRGLMGFVLMLAAVRAQNWQEAHDQCLASRYARQVPKRARANAELLLTGAWPAQHPNDLSVS